MYFKLAKTKFILINTLFENYFWKWVENALPTSVHCWFWNIFRNTRILLEWSTKGCLVASSNTVVWFGSVYQDWVDFSVKSSNFKVFSSSCNDFVGSVVMMSQWLFYCIMSNLDCFRRKQISRDPGQWGGVVSRWGLKSLLCITEES